MGLDNIVAPCLLCLLLSLSSLIVPSSSWLIPRHNCHHRHHPTRRTTILLGSLGGASKQEEIDIKQRQGSNKIYSMPSLYDLAFSYRDYESEVDFLLDVHHKITNNAASDVIELGAGPARHSINALQRNLVDSVYCIDLSPEMRQYAMDVAQEEFGRNTGISNPEHQKIMSRFQYRTDDMRSFEYDGPLADTAWILLGSLQHLLTNDDIVRCFKSVHRSLRDRGTLTIELPHPRETFSMVECTRNGWKVPLEDESGNDDGELKIIWGDDDDVFDPIKQVRQFTVKMNLVQPGRGKSSKRQKAKSSAEIQSVSAVVPTRLFTAQEIDALARCSDFEVVEMYGALEDGVNIDDDEAAFRLVCVLRKC